MTTSAAVRPRRGRITAFSASVVVTATAFLGGAGVLPSGGQPAEARPADSRPPERPAADALLPTAQEQPATDVDPPSLPGDSGEGRRVVFDMSDQHVWLVTDDETVQRSYPVSGSLYDNLDPGSYEVYSRSKDAVGIDGSTMHYMVRFTQGDNAAIGFHDIPTMAGKYVQTRAELGTPLSHGCVRQARPDAKALWRFAPVGTTVVVTA